MEKDITTNDLLCNNDVFADIADVNLFGGKRVILPEDLEAMPTDSSYKDLDGQHHRLFRDVLKKVRKLGGCIAFLGYENQTDVNNVMPVRDMGYAYTVYARQIQELVAENSKAGHSAYTKVLHDGQKLLPVVTMVLYFGKKKWEKPLSLMDVLDIPEEEKEFWLRMIDDHKIRVIHMADQPEEIRRQYQSDFGIIADYLAYNKSKNELNDYLREDTRKLVHVEQVLDMLQAISGDKRFDTMKEHYLECDDKRECDSMCLLLDMCEEEGMRKGIQQGRLEGSDLKLISMICRKLAKGKPAEMIAEELDEEPEIVDHICETAVKFAPEYDVDKIYEAI